MVAQFSFRTPSTQTITRRWWLAPGSVCSAVGYARSRGASYVLLPTIQERRPGASCDLNADYSVSTPEQNVGGTRKEKNQSGSEKRKSGKSNKISNEQLKKTKPFQTRI
ncbi:hypothetical protein EVAR_64395_1 [Eumeta japonica]|uniref:Uncharacterized protein n=1 Tax=Eumeta variegata TaxID=151549 RepID=A0A4C1SLS0_EUMVA|nr:hypothetical protein EVAR_64395_1 [Eumeta japonica]